jgi:hypothetical protein
MVLVGEGIDLTDARRILEFVRARPEGVLQPGTRWE